MIIGYKKQHQNRAYLIRRRRGTKNRFLPTDPFYMIIAYFKAGIKSQVVVSIKSKRIGIFFTVVVSSHLPSSTWSTVFVLARIILVSHNLSHHNGIQTVHIRSSTRPTVAWRRKRSLKGSQGNMEVVEKPNGHKLCAINYVTFFLLGDADHCY